MRAGFERADFAEGGDEFGVHAVGEVDADGELVFGGLFPFDADGAEGGGDVGGQAGGEGDAEGELVVGGWCPFEAEGAEGGGDDAAGEFEFAGEGGDADLFPADVDGLDAEDLLGEVVDGGGGPG